MPAGLLLLFTLLSVALGDLTCSSGFFSFFNSSVLSRSSGSGLFNPSSIAVDSSFIYATGSLVQNVVLGTSVTSTGAEDILITKISKFTGAVQWNARFGSLLNDRGLDVKIDASSRIYVVGSFSSTMNFGSFSRSTNVLTCFIMQLTSTGNVAWVLTFSHTSLSSYSVCSKVTIISNTLYIIGYVRGDFNVGGLSSTRATESGFVLRVSNTGAASWMLFFSATSSRPIDIVGTSPLYVLGTFSGSFTSPSSISASGASDAFICSVSTSGSVTWVSRIGGTGQENAVGLALSSTSRLFALGSFIGSTTLGSSSFSSVNNATFVAELNTANGAVIRSTFINSTLGTSPYAISLDSASNIHISGTFSGRLDVSELSLQSTQTEGFLIKLNSSLGLINAVKIASLSNNTIVDTISDTNGDIYGMSVLRSNSSIGGTSFTFPTSGSAALYRLDYQCSPCSPGHSSSIGNYFKCFPCQRGFFSSSFGASSCSPCEAGTFSSSLGSSNCTQCPIAHYNWQPGQTSNASCTPCPAGTYSQNGGLFTSNLCLPCPIGTYSSFLGVSSCISCPNGTSTLQTASTSVSACSGCQAGRYRTSANCELCPAGTFSQFNSISCTACPVGTFSGIGASSCSQCPIGTFSTQNMSTACLPCPAGSSTISPGSTQCTNCSRGTYSVNGTCILCPAGYYQPVAGASSCLRCLPNSFSATLGATNCSNCSNGFYQPLSNASSCISCPVAHYSSFRTNFICTPCPIGTYSTANALQNVSQCILCPSGSYSDRSGSSSCSPCPRGTFSTIIGATTVSQCVTCPAGTYQPNLNSSFCVPCPASSFSSATGASSISACVLCPAGTFSRMQGSSSSSSCLLCPRGTYSSSQGATFCLSCPRGTYSSQTGMTSPSSCLSCPSGTFQPNLEANASSACLPCSAGTFSTTIAATSQASCISCPAGSFSASRGSTSCTKCRIGTFTSIQGSSSCQTCPQNTINTAEGSTSCAACKSNCCSDSSFSSCVCDTTCKNNAGGVINPGTAGNSTFFIDIHSTSGIIIVSSISAVVVISSIVTLICLCLFLYRLYDRLCNSTSKRAKLRQQIVIPPQEVELQPVAPVFIPYVYPQEPTAPLEPVFIPVDHQMPQMYVPTLSQDPVVLPSFAHPPPENPELRHVDTPYPNSSFDFTQYYNYPQK